MSRTKSTVVGMEEFIRHLRLKEAPDRTIETYGSAVRVFFDRFDHLDPETIQENLTYYKTPRSKRTILAALKAFTRHQGIDVDWNHIVLPRKKKSMPRVLEQSEQDRVWRWIRARDPYYAKLFIFMLHTALRSSEVRKLTPRDLMSDSTGGTYLLIRDPKNCEDRNVPLDSVASRIVKELGLPFNFRRQKLTDYIKEAREELGIPKFTPHVLRKTCLTRLHHQHGADVVALARFSGHRDINSLMDYLGSSPEHVRNGIFRNATSR